MVDEQGHTVVMLRPSTRSKFAALSGDLVGFRRTQAIDQERTTVEYAGLLADSGFDFKEVKRLAALPSVIVGVAR